MSALDSGKSLLQQILGKLPEHVRAVVTPAFEAPEAVDALTLLGDATLARSDYSRQLDAINADKAKLDAEQKKVDEYKATLDGWWNENHPKVQQFDVIKPEYDKLKAGGGTPPAPTPPAPATGLTRDELDGILRERDAGYASVLAVTTQLATDHFAKFHEVLNVQDLIVKANAGKMTLLDAYRTVHGEKLQAAEKAAEDARISKLVDERMAEERKKGPLPFPLRGGQMEPSALDQLAMTPEQRQQRFTADAAADRYEQLTQASTRGA
jgi:hypothetical protein